MSGFSNRRAARGPRPGGPGLPARPLADGDHAGGRGRVVLQECEGLSFLGTPHEHFLAGAAAYADGRLPPTTVAAHVLRGVAWCSETGVLVADDGEALVESAMDRWRLESMDLAEHARADRLAGEPVATSVWHDWGHNYYHWVVDCLPRTYAVAALARRYDMTLLVPESINPVQEFTLRRCVPPSVTIRRVPPRRLVVPDQFVFPAFVTKPRCGYVPPLPLAHVRGALLPCAAGRPGAGAGRVFVSRAGCHYRRVTNEPAVAAALREFGFVTVRLEGLPLAEQVAVFRHARAVVAPHGAGLANLLFGAPTLRVLELFPCRTPEPHFFFLTRALGQAYHYLLADAPGAHDDFEVDLAALREAVGRLLGGLPD